MPVDAFEMALVHRVFRDELRCAPMLISSAQPGPLKQLKRVADHIANVLSALHHHHMGEDELLWSELQDRISQQSKDIRRMETEHELIATSAGKGLIAARRLAYLSRLHHRCTEVNLGHRRARRACRRTPCHEEESGSFR